MSNFDEIKRLHKRALHFCGPMVESFAGYEGWRKRYEPVDWLSLVDRKALTKSLLTLLSNYEAMQSDDDTYIEKLCWIDAFARAMNRWIDKHRVNDEPQSKLVMNWWRDQLFFDPAIL